MIHKPIGTMIVTLVVHSARIPLIFFVICLTSLCGLTVHGQKIRIGHPLDRQIPNPPQQNVGDLVILRSGQIEKGDLRACLSLLCQLSAKSISRDQIVWIGLSTAIATPPIVSEPSQDEVHLRDGSMRTGHLEGVNAEKVVTTMGSYDRAQVRWIHLAPPPPRPPLQGEIEHPEIPGNKDNGKGPDGNSTGKKKTGPPKGNEPPPSNNPPATRPPGPGGEVKACPANLPLGGLIEVSSEWNENGCRGTRHAKLRFPLVNGYPPMPYPGKQTWGAIFYAPEVYYDISTGGCLGTRMNGSTEETVTAQSGRKVGNIILGKLGPLGFEPNLQNEQSNIEFHPVDPWISATINLENVHFFTPGEIDTHSGSGVYGWEWEYRFSGIDIRAGHGHDECSNGTSDWGNSSLFCLPPTDCSNPTDEATRRNCVVHADRHAIVPFAGELHWTNPKGTRERIQSSKVQWKICCGCGAPPTPPEPSNDPCSSTLEADSRLETNRKKREEKLNEVIDAGKAYDETLAEAKDHYPDYEKTIKACLIQGLATKVLIALIAPELGAHGAAEEVAAAIEFAEAQGMFPPMGMQMVAKIVEKIINGEDPTTALKSENSQNWAETIAVLQKVETLLAGEPGMGMEKSLEECLGSVLVSAETKLSASKCIESFKAALEHLAEFNKLTNDMRDLDNEYPDLQYKAWAACVQRARCQNRPESDCDSKKPPGNWPPVQ